MTKRKRLSRLARTRIFNSTDGQCCLCKLPIHASRGQKWIVEHIKPLWLSGADDESNMAPAHQSCAIVKTTGEAPVKAKSDRVRANHLGIRKRSTFPCGRNSPWRKKVSGEVVRR